MRHFALPGRYAWAVYLFVVTLACIAWYHQVWSDGIIGLFDWRKDEFYLAYLIGSLREQGMVPTAFFAVPANFEYPTLAVTRLYFANPEVLYYSPFLGLARLLSSESFFLALLGIHLALAALGIYGIGRHFRLALVFRVFAFVLIVLNPWLMQHLAIGYGPWFNALLVPLVVWLLLSGREHPLALGAAALVSALMVYQGGFHIWLWMNMAIAAIATSLALMAGSRGIVPQTALYGSLTVLAATPRLLAIGRAFAGFRRDVIASYASLSDLFGLLLDTTTNPYQLPDAYDVYGTHFYDGSLVMGPAWLVALATACLLVVQRVLRCPSAGRLSAALLVSATIFVAFGWDGVWRSMVSGLPLLSAEIYPWRFLIVAVTLLTFLTLYEFAQFYSTHGRAGKAFALLACLAMVPSNYARNEAFVDLAAAGESSYERFNLLQFLRDRLPAEERETHRPVPPRMVSDHLIYPPSARGYLLPWLTRPQLGSFVFSGASVEVDAVSGQTRTTASERPFVVSARPLVAVHEVALPLVLFALLQAGALLKWRRRPG